MFYTITVALAGGHLPEVAYYVEDIDDARGALNDELIRTRDAHGSEDEAMNCEPIGVSEALHMDEDGGSIEEHGYIHAMYPCEPEVALLLGENEEMFA